MHGVCIVDTVAFITEQPNSVKEIKELISSHKTPHFYIATTNVMHCSLPSYDLKL